MKSILKAMESEYGKHFYDMNDLEQLASIATFLHHYSRLTPNFKLL